MKRKLFVCMTLLLCSVIFVACGKKDGATQTEENVDVVSNASPMNDLLFSGGKPIDLINAKTMTITPNNQGAKVDIRFVLGSQREGIDEANADHVPPYRVYYLEHPARLVVELVDLEFWGYEQGLSIPENGLFYSIYKEQKSLANDFCIVFQMQKDVAVAVSDAKDVLSIDFTIKPEQFVAKEFYVMADAASAFDSNKIIGGDLFSTLSNDLVNRVLISKPYQTEQAAKDDMAILLQKNSVLNDKNTFIISLEANELPSYGDSSKFAAVYTQPIIRKNGTIESLPVVMPDGLYLCSSADGSISLFSKLESDSGTDGDGFDTEMLWIMDRNHKLRPLIDIEFASISHAAFSPDGKRLAFLEKTADTSLLYVYNMETEELSNLGEERLGSMTSDFIWDTLGTALYAISGTDTQQLLKYDFTISDQSARLTAVDEQEIGEGDLGFYNGELYFANVTEENEEIIFKIKPEGGLRTEFARGGSFRISPDGQYMALIRTANTSNVGQSSEGEEDSDNNATLIIRSMTTNEELTIAEKQYVVNYEWATDGKLYYAISISEDFSDDFSFLLKVFDPITGASTDIAELGPSDFATTPDPLVIYINLIGRDEETPIRATYKFTLGQPKSPVTDTPQPTNGIEIEDPA